MKNYFASLVLKSNIKKNGGEIRIDSFNLSFLPKSFSLKGEISYIEKKVILQRVEGNYYFFSLLKQQKQFSDLNISGGGIFFLKKYEFEEDQKMPLIDNLKIENFTIEGSANKIEKENLNKIIIEKLIIKDWQIENNRVTFSFLDSNINWKEIKINAKSKDGKVVDIQSANIPIEKVREFLPTLFSPISQALIDVQIALVFPQNTKQGSLKIKVKCRDILLKDQKEFSMIEKISLPLVNTISKRLNEEGVSSEVSFEDKDFEKDPFAILIEGYQKLLIEIYRIR